MFPDSGLIGIWPDTKTIEPTVVTGVYGPIAAGTPDGKILVTDYINEDLLFNEWIFIILAMVNNCLDFKRQ